jgi:hypothetical protein
MATNTRRRAGKRPRVAVASHPGGAVAAQVTEASGNSYVMLDNLRVLITKADGSWFAQGLEIDYSADGKTVAEAKKRFQSGLSKTVDAHLRVHGNVKALLRPAPSDVWTEYFDAKNALHRFGHSQFTISPSAQAGLPFDQIVFVESKLSA